MFADFHPVQACSWPPDPASMSVYCAVQILRQKRMYETQRETLYNQQFNMEQTRFTVESIQVCTSDCVRQLRAHLLAHLTASITSNAPWHCVLQHHWCNAPWHCVLQHHWCIHRGLWTYSS
jgi:hypothetical protein